jgi:hypothetical protein
MTAAITIISDAMSEVGVLGAAETPSAEDADLCLRKLNQIMQRLSNSRLAFPVLAELSITMTGAQTYTIGPSGGTVASRPIKVNHATATDSGGNEYPVSVLTREEWDAISPKASSGGSPSCIWYQATNTNGTVNVYPQASGYTLLLHCQTLLATFATTASTVTLPDGYESLLTLMLADDIAKPFGTSTAPDTRRRLAAAMTAVRATNAAPVYLDIGMSGQPYEIARGY